MGLVWRKDDLLTLSEKQLSMANETCQQKIYAGIDVELSGGTEHFSLEMHDQANIESMFTAVTLGAKEQQYHCDGGKVKTYSAADIVVLYAAYKNYVTKHTTYCNLLKTWIKRETDNAVIGAIQYGDDLPEDLTAQMQTILNAATEQLTSITAAVSDGAFADKIASLESQMTETQMALCDAYEQFLDATTTEEG